MKMRRAALRSGMTLIELLIGLVIVSILVSMALPSFAKTIERARVKDVQAVLSSIASAERIYRIDQGGFGTLANLVSNTYVSDPDPSNRNAEWNFASSDVTPGSFTLTASRTGGGQYDTKTVTVNQAFDGSTYGGSHPLKD